MRKLITLLLFIVFATNAKAQYVNIPDSNFRNFLMLKYPSCFNSAGQMDTTCSDIVNETNLNCSAKVIKSIIGIEYFTNLITLDCSANQLTNLDNLPYYLKSLKCNNNLILNFSDLPNYITYLHCGVNKLDSLPTLPISLQSLICNYNQLTALPNLPNTLQSLTCNSNLLINLPALPSSITFLSTGSNQLKSLPILPTNLTTLYCERNQLTDLPNLPNGLRYLLCSFNINLSCLPMLPLSLKNLFFDSTLINCVPNIPPTLSQSNLPICNPTNNTNGCQSFPVIQSYSFTDNNNNNKLDTNEYPKHNLKLTLSNNNYTYTNLNGKAEINADSLGVYTITAIAPNFYNVVPASHTHNFTSYDTLVIDTFALQPIVLKDSVSIKLTPMNWAARPSFQYSYLVSYENVGTTVLSTPIIHFNYDNSLLFYDSSSANGVVNNGNNLSLNIGNIVPGQTGSFFVYFSVKPTAVLGSTVTSVASINANSASGIDSVTTIVRGSYDPNDKQATPSLTTQQVADGDYINYTIRFQNTGTDTAFNMVIADTLDSKLMATELQMVGSSHSCKTTVKDNIIFFEFLNIYLPDSNVNKSGSNGFVSFKMKPVSSVVVGTIIPNNAAIYFDYNSPVITTTANTIIQNPLPLQLLNFSAIANNEQGKVLVYWNTANEVNTSHFVIEQSLDGTEFKAAAEVAAKGVGSNSYFYSINKYQVNFIRLKMVDKNGEFSYSNIIKIRSNIDAINGLIVLENPVKHQLKLNVISPSLNNTTASLINSEGKVIKTFILKQGFETIDFIGFGAGVYYLQTNIGSKKIVIGR